MATEATVQPSTENLTTATPATPARETWEFPPVLAMTYTFPSMEPVRLIEFHQKHLQMPLRRDILHRAVVYEGDNTRQGTASTKWRDDVHGSHRKIRPQKGSGKARVGDRQSPTRRGGGVAHGPHPRDFSTDLPRKVYDQAWRIALSYRYSRGELIIIDKQISLPVKSRHHMVGDILKEYRWTKNKGRATFVTEEADRDLFEKFSFYEKHARIMDRQGVDVKNLLETGTLVIESEALLNILTSHSKDLDSQPAKATY